MDVDIAISQVERLYRSVTGSEAPASGENAYAPIPPEQDPQHYVNDQLDRLIDRLEKSASERASTTGAWLPEVSVWDGENEHLITVDIPGVPRTSINVAVEGGTVVITGDRPQPRTEKGPLRTRFLERATGAFRRAIVLPPGTRTDQIRARSVDGVLEIRVPQPKQTAKATTIPVQ